MSFDESGGRSAESAVQAAQRQLVDLLRDTQQERRARWGEQRFI